MDQERKRLGVWDFFKALFKVVIGLSLLAQSLLFLILLLVIIGAVSSVSTSFSSDGKKANVFEVPNDSALVINPEGVLVEIAPPGDPFGDALSEAFGGSSESQIGVHDLIAAIRAAKDDDRIDALVLDLQGLYVPPIYASKAYDVAAAVEAFRESGKRVVAIGDYYTQEQYLIASEADTVLMHDFGGVWIDGYGSYRTFYKALLEKLKVNAHVFRVGTFKSAIEPYIRDDMSPEAKEANLAYLSVLWNTYTAAIDSNRSLKPGSAAAYANNAAEVFRAADGDSGVAATNAGLVDQLMSRAEQVEYIAGIVGADEDDAGGFRGIGYAGYRLSVHAPEDRGDVGNVAVVTVAGAIVDGDDVDGVASGDVISGQIRDARLDEDVKALVLRVDSPGGSAFASEVMRDELLAFKKTGRPVVVSMGSLAASGGYWISASADEIWAAPTTVTGSIGVFGFFPTFENSMKEIGVSTDGVGTTSLSAFQATGIGPLPDEAAAMIQASIENVYDRFITLVAEGRNLTPARVDEIGQGRVWIGETAKELKLVDNLGNIDDAIAAAAKRAGLETWDVVGLVQEKSRFELFIENLAGADAKAQSKLIAKELFAQRRSSAVTLANLARQVTDEFKFLASFNDPAATYVRCIECTVR